MTSSPDSRRFGPRRRSSRLRRPLGSTRQPRGNARASLCVGTLEPRKNLVRAIQAHGRLPAETQVRHPLVIAGAKGWEDDQILRDAERAGARILTDVSEEELVDLYATCGLSAPHSTRGSAFRSSRP